MTKLIFSLLADILTCLTLTPLTKLIALNLSLWNYVSRLALAALTLWNHVHNL